MSKKIKQLKDTEDDIIFESEEDQTSSNVIKKLREKVKQVQIEKQEYLEGWQRSKADFINAKKDFEEEKSKLLKFAKIDLITQLIPVLDSFDMALTEGEHGKSELLGEWMVGIKHIYSQLLFIFKDNGVEQLTPFGEEFDPCLHTSLEMIEVDKEQKDGIIIEVIQKGYSFNGKVIRPAKVKVGEFKKEDIKT